MTKDVTVTLTLPAPMAWKVQQVAEEVYGIRGEQLMLMSIARALRKPRGPQVDLSQDWEIYDRWRRGQSTAAIADELGIARKTAYTRLEAMGLKSPQISKTRKSLASRKGWENRRLREQAERAAQQTAEQNNGEADRKAAEAAAKKRERERRGEGAAA